MIGHQPLLTTQPLPGTETLDRFQNMYLIGIESRIYTVHGRGKEQIQYVHERYRNWKMYVVHERAGIQKMSMNGAESGMWGS